jgi:hypothetical protein
MHPTMKSCMAPRLLLLQKLAASQQLGLTTMACVFASPLALDEFGTVERGS